MQTLNGSTARKALTSANGDRERLPRWGDVFEPYRMSERLPGRRGQKGMSGSEQYVNEGMQGHGESGELKK